VQLGGAHLALEGARAVPSLRYVLNTTPIWFVPRAASPIERMEEAAETAPAGGFAWDGRFNSLTQQAAFPLLDRREMANRNVAEVVRELERSPHAAEFRQLFGAGIFDDPQRAFGRAVEAIARFELDDRSFHPYTSKFDRYLDGEATLSAQELRGKKLFEDPRGGGCTACHSDARGADGSHPLFTDFQFEALGVPRNRALRANADARYFDLGLCGPVRRDQRAQTHYCGLFKTPTLRNVASRGAFFHNGRFHSLKDALRFYVERDTNPEKWYPKTHDGQVVKFDDVPAALRANVDTVDAPLTRARGARPVWDAADIDAVAAFLATLTDDDVSLAGGTALR
jgi:cytochrome c peroxidase